MESSERFPPVGMGGSRFCRLRVSAPAATSATAAPWLGREDRQPGTHLLRQPQQPHHAMEEAQLCVSTQRDAYTCHVTSFAGLFEGTTILIGKCCRYQVLLYIRLYFSRRYYFTNCKWILFFNRCFSAGQKRPNGLHWCLLLNHSAILPEKHWCLIQNGYWCIVTFNEENGY